MKDEQYNFQGYDYIYCKRTHDFQDNEKNDKIFFSKFSVNLKQIDDNEKRNIE